MLKPGKHVAAVLSALIVWGGLFASSASAGVVSSSEMINAEQQFENKQALRDFVERDEIKQKMQDLGVNADDVDARIDALTVEEMAQLNTTLNEAPAGAGLVGAALTVFIVFVITDVIGATDIFPFIRPVN